MPLSWVSTSLPLWCLRNFAVDFEPLPEFEDFEPSEPLVALEAVLLRPFTSLETSLDDSPLNKSEQSVKYEARHETPILYQTKCNGSSEKAVIT